MLRLQVPWAHVDRTMFERDGIHPHWRRKAVRDGSHRPAMSCSRRVTRRVYLEPPVIFEHRRSEGIMLTNEFCSEVELIRGKG